MTDDYNPKNPGDAAENNAANNGSYDQTSGQNYNADQNSTQAYGQPTGSTQSYNQGYAQNAGQGYNQNYNQGYDQGYNQDFGQQGQYAQYPHSDQPLVNNSNKDSFFGALFDLSFTKYATPSVVKVLYILLMVVVCLFVLLGAIGILVGAFSEDGPGIFGLIIGLPLLALGAIAALATYRVGLEVAVVLIRTSQSVQSIDERQERQLQSQSGNSGFGNGGSSYFGG